MSTSSHQPNRNTPPHASPLAWIDLEMTGLHPETDRILEIGMIVTDPQLNILEEFGPLAIHQPQSWFEQMSPWCQKVHTKSGLWERVQASQITEAMAEAQALAFLKRWMTPGSSPACGNTVSHDRRFLRRYLPNIEDFLHYRCIDVSSIKELAKRWRPHLLKKLKKTYPHQALEDIRNSVAELRFYRDHLFHLPAEESDLPEAAASPQPLD